MCVCVYVCVRGVYDKHFFAAFVRVLWYSHPQCLPLSPANDSCYQLKSLATSDPLPRTASTTTMKVQSSRSATLYRSCFTLEVAYIPPPLNATQRAPPLVSMIATFFDQLQLSYAHQTSHNLLGLVFTHKFRLHFS